MRILDQFGTNLGSVEVVEAGMITQVQGAFLGSMKFTKGLCTER